MAKRGLLQGRDRGVKRAGLTFSLIAFCLFSVSGCLMPTGTPLENSSLENGSLAKNGSFFKNNSLSQNSPCQRTAFAEEQPFAEERLVFEKQLTFSEQLFVLAYILGGGVSEEASKALSKEVNEVVTEEVSEKKLAWHTAVWNFAKKWGGFLWEKILGVWGLNKEDEDIVVELDINYAAIAYEQGKEYADGIISASIATLPSVRTSAAYKRALEAVSNPTTFMDTHKHLSRYGRNLDWTRVDDPTPYLFRGTRGVPRTLEAAKGVWETIPRPLGALGRRLRLDI